VVKAFMIVYQLSTMKKGMSSCEISRQYGIHQENAWFFKRKVQQAMCSGKLSLLKNYVEVDETIIGGLEKGKQGRSKGGKKFVQVAVEIQNSTESDDGKPRLKRAHAEVIDDFSSDQLGAAMDVMIDQKATVSTDQWTAYPNAVGGRKHISKPSANGENFPIIHWHIFNIKNWIRGIHHHVSAFHLTKYLKEYHYRFNRRNFIHTNPMNVLKKMVEEPWLPYSQAIAA